jgi:hypothetical protein
VDAINHACEQQRLVDEVVVGSIAPEKLVKNIMEKIEEQTRHNPFFEEEPPPLAHLLAFLLYQTTTPTNARKAFNKDSYKLQGQVVQCDTPPTSRRSPQTL